MQYLSKQPNRYPPPPRINEVLTPQACRTLLTYTLILVGSPIRLQPSLFYTACAIVIVESDISITYFDLHWVRHGNYYPTGLVQVFLRTLLPMYSDSDSITVPCDLFPMHSDWLKA